MSGVNSKFHPVASTSQNGAASAVASTSQYLPCIFKMNVDCFEDLFEYLSLKDLKSLRQTGQRMKKLIDYFIEMNFERALQMISIANRNEKRMEDFRCIEIKSFELVNYIDIWSIEFTPIQIDGIRPILGQVKTVEVSECTFDTLDFYDDFLKYCTQLKSLCVQENNIQNRGKWLHHRYPTLEHIAVGHETVEYTDLEILFKNNPNVQHFTVSGCMIWENRNSIRKSSVRIERLEIIFDIGWFLINTKFCDLLNELHEQGFFQRLYCTFGYEEEEDYRQLISLAGLEGVFDYQLKNGILPRFTNLKELSCVDGFDDVGVSEILTMASHLPNLQRFAIEQAKFEHILPFIHQCPKLTQIKIHSLQHDDIFLIENDIINLPEINKEREKLSKARKVTIFVDENIFLANKWKQNINLNLIELKRNHSWEESNPFYISYP